MESNLAVPPPSAGYERSLRRTSDSTRRLISACQEWRDHVVSSGLPRKTPRCYAHPRLLIWSIAGGYNSEARMNPPGQSSCSFLVCPPQDFAIKGRNTTVKKKKLLLLFQDHNKLPLQLLRFPLTRGLPGRPSLPRLLNFNNIQKGCVPFKIIQCTEGQLVFSRMCFQTLGSSWRKRNRPTRTSGCLYQCRRVLCDSGMCRTVL